MVSVDTRIEAGGDSATAHLLALLRCPTVSTEPSNAPVMMEGAELVRETVRWAGLRADVVETDGWPAVVGGSDDAPQDAPTVLIYGHYDVQPAGDLSLWTHPPFEPHVSPKGRITARGAADNKGQFMIPLLAIRVLLESSQRLPVRVRVLIEGEEEIGSPNLRKLLESHRAQLASDLVVVCDTPLWRPGRPALSLGTRGITGLEVTVEGPNRDLHSGMFGGSVPNPIAILARMLASLHDDDQRVAVEGFYDGVEPVSHDLAREWDALEAELGDEQLGCGNWGEAGFGTLQRRWVRPTVEFNGITGGFQGPGSNTIVPARASAKITCRLVPRQDPDRIQTLLQGHLRDRCPDCAKVSFTLRKSNSPAYSITPDHPALLVARNALQDVFGVEPARVREGLSLPILPLFRSILSADTVLLGFCDPDCRAHSFDEFFDVPDLLRGARVVARFLQGLSQPTGN
jgi:acetylornithine deacetylase/succinyl-diaminopimelate desuccinylase-like protein